MVIGALALLWYFLLVAVMQAGQRPHRESQGKKSWRIQLGICVSRLIVPDKHESSFCKAWARLWEAWTSLWEAWASLREACARPWEAWTSPWKGWALASLWEAWASLWGASRGVGVGNECTDGWRMRHTDSPCIPQDFVPSGSLRDHCPRSSQSQS